MERTRATSNLGQVSCGTEWSESKRADLGGKSKANSALIASFDLEFARLKNEFQKDFQIELY